MLKTPDSVIIYEIETGENQVPFINDGKKYGYASYIERYDPSCPMMGFLKSSPELAKYTTLQEYKTGEFERCQREIENSKMNEEEKHAYYLKTKPLADEFAKIRDDYVKEMEIHGVGNKFSKSSANKNRRQFIAEHPDLFEDRYQFIDIRFQAIIIEGVPYIDPKTNEKRYPSTIYEVDPLASYEKFLELANLTEVKERKFKIEQIEETIVEINEDYQCFVRKAKELLLMHNKVGLINPSSLGSEVYVPRRMKNKAPIAIEQFTIDDFLTADIDTIYWFK